LCSTGEDSQNTEEEFMRTLATDVRSAALFSLLLVLPLLLLELFLNQSTNWGPGSLVLYGTLYILAAGFVLALTVVVRNARAKDNTFKLVVGALAFVMLAFVWGTLVLDQMPCFLGVPNCD
jgi:hypothetical protein